MLQLEHGTRERNRSESNLNPDSPLLVKVQRYPDPLLKFAKMVPQPCVQSGAQNPLRIKKRKDA